MRGVTVEFWPWLETNFPPGGPRRHLREVLGPAVVAGLERSRVFQVSGRPEQYPCNRSRLDDCPRRVIETGGRIRAVCGNHPPQCEDVDLTDEDVESLGLRELALCEALVAVLELRPPKCQAVDGLRAAYRVGTFHPVAGIRHPIYLVVRCRDSDYAEAIDALRSRGGEPFGLLIPTDRFVSEGTRRILGSTGSVIISLDERVRLSPAGLEATRECSDLLFRIGTMPSAAPTTRVVVARALVKQSGGTPTWRELDQEALDRLRATATAFDIFADAPAMNVSKGKGKARKTVSISRESYFDVFALAVATRGGFDPSQYEDRWRSANQIFQRARNAIDHGARNSWALFKRRAPDGLTRYYFEPDEAVSFALVFLPDQVPEKHSRDIRATR